MKGIRGDGKTRTKYPDYTETASGVQYKDVKVGAGEMPKDGERVVIDWEGYTIGYYGRIFQKKNSVQGGAFAEDPGFYRFVLGTNSLVPGLEEGIKGMKPGGVRQIVVPPGPLSYPEDDSPHKRYASFSIFSSALHSSTFVPPPPPPSSPSPSPSPPRWIILF